MKQKEIVQLGVAVVILAVAGYFVYSLLTPQKSSSSQKIMYEKVTPLNSNFDRATLTTLSDNAKYRDFYTEPDLKNGLGNTQPFGR